MSAAHLVRSHHVHRHQHGLFELRKDLQQCTCRNGADVAPAYLPKARVSSQDANVGTVHIHSDDRYAIIRDSISIDFRHCRRAFQHSHDTHTPRLTMRWKDQRCTTSRYSPQKFHDASKDSSPHCEFATQGVSFLELSLSRHAHRLHLGVIYTRVQQAARSERRQRADRRNRGLRARYCGSPLCIPRNVAGFLVVNRGNHCVAPWLYPSDYTRAPLDHQDMRAA